MIIPYKDNSFFLNKDQIDGIIEKLSSEEVPQSHEERQQFDEDRIAVYKMIISNIITISFGDDANHPSLGKYHQTQISYERTTQP